MNNPKTRDDDERSSIANQKRQNQTGTEKEAHRAATNNAGLQDDHDPNDLGQKLANKPNAEKSQREGPAAYATHEDEAERAFPDRKPEKKKTGEF